MSSADRVSLFSSKSPSFFSNLVPLSKNFSWSVCTQPIALSTYEHIRDRDFPRSQRQQLTVSKL